MNDANFGGFDNHAHWGNTKTGDGTHEATGKDGCSAETNVIENLIHDFRGVGLDACVVAVLQGGCKEGQLLPLPERSRRWQ